MSMPIEYGTYEQGKVRLEQGDFGTYLIVNCATSEDILIQSDTDFPSLAVDFGFSAHYPSIQEAIGHLDDRNGTTIDDPGYFGE